MTKQENYQFTIPENKIIITPLNSDDDYKLLPDLIHDFRGHVKRDWFVNHAYFCLPLTIGNQYGIGIKSLSTFEVEWNGGNGKDDVIIHMIEKDTTGLQTIAPWFGMGTITVNNSVAFMTPAGVNIMTMNPPNLFIDGLINMNGVVETDNLKRDFTFNIRVTRPNHRIRINKGDIISAMFPISRYFIDGFSLENANESMESEYTDYMRQITHDFGKERNGPDRDKPHTNGRRYFNGEDVYGCPFHDHQKKVIKK